VASVLRFLKRIRIYLKTGCHTEVYRLVFLGLDIRSQHMAAVPTISICLPVFDVLIEKRVSLCKDLLPRGTSMFRILILTSPSLILFKIDVETKRRPHFIYFL
jgi:hypothetical protein